MRPCTYTPHTKHKYDHGLILDTDTYALNAFTPIPPATYLPPIHKYAHTR